MKKTEKKSVWILQKITCLYVFTSKKVFPKILNTLYMQMGISFNLISINFVPVHKPIVW